MQTTLDLNSKPNPKPFLKWAGGKSQLLHEIEAHLPKDINESKVISSYFEPFIGGGAVFFHLMSKYDIENSYISDVNEELILTYKVIQKEPKKLIKALKTISKDYKSHSKSKDELKEFYYNVRTNYNETLLNFDFNFDKCSKEHIICASQMIFLNKTCFNGLFRVNKKGEFNVPCAYPKNPLICDEDNIMNVSKALKNTTIEIASYLDCEELIINSKNKPFVYLDPPYRPLDGSSSFDGYSKFVFNDDSQKELGEFCKRISANANVLLSNSDPTNVDENDTFFKDIYEPEFNIDSVYAKRFINSKGDKRGPIKEILVSNFEY